MLTYDITALREELQNIRPKGVKNNSNYIYLKPEQADVCFFCSLYC
jgi:hypothetical protein